MSPVKGLSVKEPLSFILVGVGGQGTILASNVLAELGLKMGYDVKKAEVHGMSQRGGSVTSHLRWGQQVFSPIVPEGEADYYLAFEKLEALRFAASVKRGGTALVNNHAIEPTTIISGGPTYPDDNQITIALKQITEDLHWVDGQSIAEKLGNPRVANMVMLGALAALMSIDSKDWLEVIEAAVPAKSVEINRKAFIAGQVTIKNGEEVPRHTLA